MVRFWAHVVAVLVFPSPSVKAVPRPSTGGESNDVLALIQHSLKGGSQTQRQTASLAGRPPAKKSMTPEERQKARQRQKQKIEREAKAKGCPTGYRYVVGDVPGGDQFGRDNKHKTETIELCMEDCASNPLCMSFEWSPNSHTCNSNKEAPQKYAKPWQDFMLCVRNASQSPASASAPLALAATNESSAAAANESSTTAAGGAATGKAAEEASASASDKTILATNGVAGGTVAKEAPAKQIAAAQVAEAAASSHEQTDPGTKELEQGSAKEAAAKEAHAKQTANVEAHAKQPAEPKAPSTQPAEAEAPSTKPVEVDALSKQAVAREALAKRPAEPEAPAKQASEPKAPSMQSAEVEAPSKKPVEAEALPKQAALPEALAKQPAEPEAPAKQAAEPETAAKQAVEPEAMQASEPEAPSTQPAKAKALPHGQEEVTVNAARQAPKAESPPKAAEGVERGEANGRAKEEAVYLERTEAEHKAEEQEKEAQAFKEQQDRLTREEAERKAKDEAESLERKAKEEFERPKQQEAGHMAEEEAKKSKDESDRLAQEEAQRKAKDEADRLERKEVEAKEEAAGLERQEAEHKAEEEARKANEEADRLTREEAEHKARGKAESFQRKEVERKAEKKASNAMEEVDPHAQEEAERRAQEEAHPSPKEEEGAARLELEKSHLKVAEEAERKTMEAACSGGYVFVEGDVPGWDQFGHENVKKSKAHACQRACDAVEDCLSYEWSPTTRICSLNKEHQPTLGRFEDYVFCQRSQEYYEKWREKKARLAQEKTEAAEVAKKGSDEERRGQQQLESQARARLEHEDERNAEKEQKEAEATVARAAKEAKLREEEEARTKEEFSMGMVNIEEAAAEDEAEEKRKKEAAKKQAEELAKQQAEEAAAAERKAKEAQEAEQHVEQKAVEEARQLHEEEKRRQAEEEAHLKAEEEARQRDIADAVQRAQEQEEQTRAAEAASEKVTEEAKRKVEEDANKLPEEQKKAEEEKRLRELEKTDPSAAALQRRKAMFKVKMAAALERKRLALEKKRKKETDANNKVQAANDKMQAIELEIKQRQQEEAERRQREEELARQKQDDEEARRRSEEEAKEEANAREAAQLILKEQEDRERQTQAEQDQLEQKVIAASRPLAPEASDSARKAMITLRVQDTHGKAMVLKISRSTRLKVLMRTACSRLGLQFGDTQFTQGGRQMTPTDTVESFGLSDNDLIKVDDFIKVDEFLEAEETKDEDPAAKAAREMFEAAQREWEGAKAKNPAVAELSSTEKASVTLRDKSEAAKWQAGIKGTLLSLPAPRPAEEARMKAAKVVPLLKDTEIDGLIFGSLDNHAVNYWGNTKNISRFDIPGLRAQDSTYRFKRFIKGGHKTVTCWPSGLALASTWDEQLVGQVAGAMAAEMRGKGANLMVGPSVGVVRVASGGRNFEQLSGEDPFLGARLAKSFVQAVQKEGVMASVRSFGFLQQETNRKTMNVEVSDKVAFELYYPPFEAAIQAGAAGVTCSSVKVNGTMACEHSKLLQTDLKGSMKFAGFVMSEEPPVSGTGSLDGGLDVIMPSLAERKVWPAQKAQAEASQQAKKEAATRVLTSMYRSRMDEMPPWQPSLAMHTQSSEQRTQPNTDLALHAATAAVTLLKNNGVLPLNPASIKRIAVLGNAASTGPQVSFTNPDYYSGGGPAHVPAGNGVEATALEQIMRRAKAAQIMVETGPFNATAAQAKELAGKVDVVVVVGAATSGEVGDRPSLSLDDNVDALIAAAAPLKPTVVLMQTPGAVLTPWRDQVAAVANLFLAGEATGKAWAAVLFGDVSPAGKLPLVMPRTDVDVIMPQPGSTVQYSEGLHTSYRSSTFVAAFPFGHGLSYTDFTYGTPQVLTKGCLARACIRLDVTNTGERPGAEVVQAYVQFAASENMPRMLRSFHKTAVLKPGHREEVFLVLTPRDLSTYHPGVGWVEQSNVKLEIGSSSADIRQSAWVNSNAAVDVGVETP